MNRSKVLTMGISAIVLAPYLVNGMMGYTPKTYSSMYYHAPIQTLEQKVNTKKAEYVKERNGVEYIEYDSKLSKNINKTNRMPIKYHSNVKRKTINYNLKQNECVYDGFIIQGEEWFRNDIIKALTMMKEHCKEEYDTVRNGIINEKKKYHSGCGLIIQSIGHRTRQIKKNNEIQIGKDKQRNRGNGGYYNDLAGGIGNEGYRLVYYDEWYKLSWMDDEKEGMIIKHNILKKLNASPRALKWLEGFIDEPDRKKFHKMMTGG